MKRENLSSMKKWSIALALLTTLPNSFASQASQKPGADGIPADVSFQILRAERKPPIKCSLDIRLNKRVSESVLRALALKLKAMEKDQFQNFFILYFLPGMALNGGAWATTHFNPNLEVKILGMTEDQGKKAADKAPSSSAIQVIGQWIDEAWPATVIFSKESGRIFMEFRYKGERGTKKEMVSEPHNGQTRYREKAPNHFGEYFVIDKDGNLAIYDNQGFIRTALKSK